MDLKYTYYTAVYLVVMCISEQECTGTEDCQPFGTPLSSQCTSAERLQREYTTLDGQLNMAATREQLPDFVLATTMGMYLFLHPCLQETEAAVVLFYTEDGPNSSTPNSLEALVGRRKRAYTFQNDNDLLSQQLKDLVQNTNAGCVQFLIEKYKNISAITFRLKHPNFHVQTTAPTLATTLSISTSTTTPMVTTVAETTSSTAATTLTSPVTYGPISCTSCSGLLCLLGNHVTQCPDGLFFCQTTVEETDTGRQLTRGCSSKELCDSFAQHQNQTLCNEADKEILEVGITCRFCCLGHNCNRVPHVIPDPSTLYPPSTSA